jgi:hypothetical protein
MVLVFIAFQQNEKKKILWVQASAGLVFSIHFFLLGAFTGMGMNMVEIPRNLVLAREHNKKWQIIWVSVFIALFAAFGIFTWESPMSLFPVFAVSLSTVAFSLKKPRSIRFCQVPVSVLWLVYNVVSFSIAGILTESFCLLSVLIAILRFDILKKKENSK